MIPVSLTIKGLYSYQKEQHIDFSRLMEGQLFGIFGTVGSGKSSILEAISYALYGDTERMNRNDNRSYNMMNLKSNELLIDFIFDNYDNNRYRFLVRGKRNSKNFDKVSTLDRNAYKLVNEQWQPLESASGEEIIGLSYDNFRRTIIIPQGKFQEFLQLGDSERTRMLKDIFQLDKYEFFFQTAALERSNQEAIHLLNGELAVYAAVSEELIRQNEGKLREYQTKLKDLQERVTTKEHLFKEYEQIKQWHFELQNCEQLLQSLKEKEAVYVHLRKQIQDFEYCAIHFKELINNIGKSKTEISKSEENTGRLKDDLDAASKRLSEDEAELLKWKKDFDQKDINLSLLNDYEIVLKVLIIGEELSKLTGRIPAGEKFLRDVLESKNNLTGQLLQKRNVLKIKKSTLPDLHVLSEIRAWFVKYHHEKELLGKEKEALELKNNELAELAQKAQTILNNKIFINAPANFVDATAFIQQLQVKLNGEENELRNLLTSYQVQIKLGEFSSTLQAGEACLLCGSLEHPQILVIEDVQEHLNLVEAKLRDLVSKHKDLNDLSQEIAVLSGKESDVKQQHQQIAKRISEIEDKIQLLGNNFHWEGYNLSDENRVLQQFAQTREQSLVITSLEQEEEKLQVAIAEAEEKFNKYKEAVDQLHKQANERQSEINILKQQIKAPESEFLFEESNDVIKDKVAILKRFMTEVEVNYERFLTKVNTEKQDILIIRERLKITADRLQEELGRLQMLESRLAAEITQSEYSGMEEIATILSQTADLTQQKAELKQYEEQLYSCKENHGKVKALLGDKVFEPEAYDALVNEINLLKEEHKVVNSDLIKAEAILVKQHTDHQRKLALEAQLDKLSSRAENITVLKNLFKGSGFVSYISSVYLNQLCASANERFYKLSRQQLRLEVTDKNDFQVRDYLNDGRVRSVKTLSGGQTFQASLALALALAESVQQQNKAMQNFFFLDEGFGSLDKESLQVAFDTLKSLRKENRLVGVISHVEELQQEIDVYLSVSNTSSEGSTVKGSWE